MRLEDVKDRIDNFFDQISSEELFDILTEEFGFPVEYSNDGLFEVASSGPLTRQYELDRDANGHIINVPTSKVNYIIYDDVDGIKRCENTSFERNNNDTTPFAA
ncbi:hypothetical protein [Porphyromonas somerae]|uniref:hypothetical protein n=1 Tax=Porphyromonas somerae TaxID=322095 RepID=UPI001FCB277F|nr:hypothetical protein [Porphyromonas somerae]BDE81964.1 hypothetical protein CE91St14_09920 [Porphyromonas somerae]